MIKEREYHEDEKTVLLDHQGQVPAQGPLTDSPNRRASSSSRSG